MNTKEKKRFYRHNRIRKKVSGSNDKPRVCVFRSSKNLYAQVINDDENKVLFGMSTLTSSMKDKIKNGGNIEAASILGEAFAQEVTKKGIKKIVFDRGGYLYHGRVKAFADGARKGGLEF